MMTGVVFLVMPSLLEDPVSVPAVMPAPTGIVGAVPSIVSVNGDPIGDVPALSVALALIFRTPSPLREMPVIVQEPSAAAVTAEPRVVTPSESKSWIDWAPFALPVKVNWLARLLGREIRSLKVAGKPVRPWSGE